ncbi:hypothetical protein RF11_13830 [Thelohanellus kitauei]|uniref:Uncharacterized protein n=1 Tax=Thelohanellus kitauei TaxID=669202 RepID=A0A0C2MDT0_THEKT|nr:hypothetical protein RF11_13830 [Thelohanellus kitauei]
MMKMLPALAFVPMDQVISYFETLEDYISNNNAMDSLRGLFEYFEDAFIGRLRRNARTQPIFPLNMVLLLFRKTRFRKHISAKHSCAKYVSARHCSAKLHFCKKFRKMHFLKIHSCKHIFVH